MVMAPPSACIQRPWNSVRARAWLPDRPLAWAARRISSASAWTWTRSAQVSSGLRDWAVCCGATAVVAQPARASAAMAGARIGARRGLISAWLLDHVSDGTLPGAAGVGARRRIDGLVQLAEQDGVGVVGEAQAVGGSLEGARVLGIDDIGGDQHHHLGVSGQEVA